MPLSAGFRVGPYVIAAPLGAGGMGEVYRARDTRLDRDVAVKVLPERIAEDPEALSRFEREAKAVAALSHPNILAIYDFGNQDGTAYAAMELLDGETLRQRLRANEVPLRKALEHAQQIARGLAAAHHKGIVHRDLKPENIFITKDGRVKILDFGLARQTLFETADPDSPTFTRQTEPGTVLGTVGYMSPEQVTGRSADHRSDIFSFGCVLYEMLSGTRPFQRDTTAETIAAILKEEPLEIAESKLELNPGVGRIARHCLEKNPEERFQSAADLAFALEPAAGASTRATGSTASPASGKPGRALSYLALAIAGLALAYVVGRRTTGIGAASPSPSFKRLTYRNGTIRSARFAPDGQAIVYGAAWEGAPIRLFQTRADGYESPPLNAPPAEVLSISPAGEMAVSLGHAFEALLLARGTLARVPLLGGAPRPVLEGVRAADWAPDGSGLAVVRRVGAKDRLEFPVGKVLYETDAWISQLRFSRNGDQIAFLDHGVLGGDLGVVAIVDRAGNHRTLSSSSSKRGLAWSPNGSEVWFSNTREGNALRAVDLSGHERTILSSPGFVILLDVSREGRALVAAEELGREILAMVPGERRTRDLSWLGMSSASDISADGKTLLIRSTFAGGSGSGVYLRKADGSPPVRLGGGQASGLSPDESWAVSIIQGSPSRVLLLPTGTGEAKTLPTNSLTVDVARWLPDGRRLVLAAREPGHGPRLYLQDVAGGAPRAFTPEGAESLINFGLPVSPDGGLVAAFGPAGSFALYPVDGGAPREVAGSNANDVALGWSPDGLAYAWSIARARSTLYVVDGLR